MYRPDISVFGPDATLQAVVEVKAIANKDAEWAAKLRRNLFAHGDIPPAHYFLLALSDSIYLWKDAVGLGERLPDLELDTKHVLNELFSHFNQHQRDISEHALELYIVLLLETLSVSTPDAIPEGWGKSLADIGFLDAIKDASIKADTAS